MTTGIGQKWHNAQAEGPSTNSPAYLVKELVYLVATAISGHVGCTHQEGNPQGTIDGLLPQIDSCVGIWREQYRFVEERRRSRQLAQVGSK